MWRIWAVRAAWLVWLAVNLTTSMWCFWPTAPAAVRPVIVRMLPDADFTPRRSTDNLDEDIAAIRAHIDREQGYFEEADARFRSEYGIIRDGKQVSIWSEDLKRHLNILEAIKRGENFITPETEPQPVRAWDSFLTVCARVLWLTCLLLTTGIAIVFTMWMQPVPIPIATPEPEHAGI